MSSMRDDLFSRKAVSRMALSSSVRRSGARVPGQVPEQASSASEAVIVGEGSLFVLALVRLFVGLLWFQQLFWKLPPGFIRCKPCEVSPLTFTIYSSILLNNRRRQEGETLMDTQTKRAFKNVLYEQFARIGKALSSGHRLEMLEVLAQGERSVEALALETGLSVANASQHLQVLRAAQLVEVRRDGVYVYYRLTDERVFRLWQSMREVGEIHLAEIDRVVETYLHDRRSLQPITAEELRQRMSEGTTILLDVRPVDEYQAGHIPQALSMPLAHLGERLPELSPEQDVIAYCRGPYCVFADEAVALLRARGYRARRLEEGLPDWRAAGFPVERGTGA